MTLNNNVEKKLEELGRAIGPDDTFAENVMARITAETACTKKHKSITRIFLTSKLTKLTAAAVIIIAVLIGITQFGGSIDGSSVAWAELVQRVERSHDEYMKQLLLATEEKDTEKINFYADLLDEFWQKLGWLAKAELHPEQQSRILAGIAGQKSDEHEESDQIGIRIFLEYADQFNNWLGNIKDITWINETIHVCKQMEEYAEEIRDAARSSKDGLPYIEHYMPSFLAYSNWFKQLPWDDPSEQVGLNVLLAAIERDLEIARWEIMHPKNHDAGRFVKRCVQQAQKNVLEVGNKVASIEMENQWKLYRKLTRRIDELYDLITYVTIASWDIQQTNQIQRDEALRQALTKEFGNKASFADYFIERIDQSLDLCKQLLEELESME